MSAFPIVHAPAQQFDKVLRLLIYCFRLPQLQRAIQLVRLRLRNIKKTKKERSVWGKQWAAAAGKCVLRDSAQNWVKSSELKTHHCQSPGDINNMLAPLWPFIIACLAITGSLTPASKKKQSICTPLSFGIYHHNYCSIVLKVKATP